MFSRITAITTLLVCLLGTSIPASHGAKIYHWVDDKGQAHYSESLPPEQQAEQLNIRPHGSAATKVTPSSSVNSNNDKAATSTEPKALSETEGLIVEHSAADKAKYCQQSRTLLQQMNNNTQRRFKQEDGSYRKLEAAEISNYQAQAQSGIERFCN